MKTLKSIMVFAFAMVFSISFINGQTSIDTEKSSVAWKGYKVTGSHTGTMNIKSGALEMTEGKLTGGNIVIDMTSLVVTGMGEDMQTKLEGHLKSADFFSVEEFHTAILNITKVVSRGAEGAYKVTGDLTIKGITKPIKFNISTNEGLMVAELVIDRSDYNVRYGSGSFFDNLGDKTIYDEFELTVSIAVK